MALWYSYKYVAVASYVRLKMQVRKVQDYRNWRTKTEGCGKWRTHYWRMPCTYIMAHACIYVCNFCCHDYRHIPV